MTGAQIERARAKERGDAVVGDVLLRYIQHTHTHTTRTHTHTCHDMHEFDYSITLSVLYSLFLVLYFYLFLYHFPFRDADYDEFEAMLHGLSVSRPLIKAAMGFAFDKVESAKEVT